MLNLKSCKLHMRLQQHNKILTVNLMYFIFQTLPNDIFSTKQFVLGLTQYWMMKAQLPQLEN